MICPPRTSLELVRWVMLERGVPVTYGEADGVLWNETGFPFFWRTDSPVQEIVHSVREFLDTGVSNHDRLSLFLEGRKLFPADRHAKQWPHNAVGVPMISGRPYQDTAPL